jgi:outer membrane receptor protein involved in Fe transport
LDVGEAGTVDIKAVATYLLSYDSQSIPGGAVTDCVGQWGSTCTVPNPELAANLRATWYSPYDLSISTSLRFVDSVTSDDGARPSFASQTYVDLSSLYEYKFLNFRIGANNLFDRQPPIAGNPPQGNGNTYAEAYDGLGRYVFFGVGANF